MDEQSKATLEHLLPDLAALIEPLVPNEALLLRLEDRWDTFSDGGGLRTMTADFAPDENGPSLKTLRHAVSDRMAAGAKHLEFEEEFTRDVYQRGRTVLRVSIATTQHAQGYSFETLRVDAKISAPSTCPFSFSPVFDRFRKPLGDAGCSSAFREHAMNLEAPEKIAVVTERVTLEGVESSRIEALASQGFKAQGGGAFRLEQGTGEVGIRVDVAPDAKGISLTCLMAKATAA